MIYMILALVAAPTEPFRLTAHFEKVRLVWEDVDGDGSLEIWARTDQDELWIHDGRSDSTEFALLAKSEMFPNMRPFLDGDTFVAVAYEAGFFYRFNGDEWRVFDDLSDQVSRNRQGFSFQQGTFVLPSASGYLWQKPQCDPSSIAVRPVVLNQSRTWRIVYPVPQSKDRYGANWYLPPVVDKERGTCLLQVLDVNDGYANRVQWVPFPYGLGIANYTYGDINGDGAMDLALLGLPEKDFSVFDELSLVVIMGDPAGGFEDHVLVSIETEQNLWQSGPITIEPGAIACHYYKGLIRSKFKRDLYLWNEGGYVEPKPKSVKWKIEEANRGAIAVDLDMTGDGLPDLILQDSEGLRLHPRSGAEPLKSFSEQPDRLEFDTDSSFSVDVGVGASGSSFSFSSKLDDRNRFRGRDGYALIERDGVGEIWRVEDRFDHILVYPVKEPASKP